MRIEVLGSNGQLGRELVSALAASAHQPSGHPREVVDIRDKSAVAAVLDEVQPDAVVNCAAWTAVDAAEADPAGASAVNAGGTLNLAEACRDRDILLCHISTDYVFDGAATSPIDEEAVPNPRSAYGRSKLAGEEAVRATWARHQIVRTAWLYGQDGPNFVLTMLRLARQRDSLRVVGDQRGTPTWTGHLAAALVRLLERATLGTFHLSAGGETTWHGFATAVLEEAGLQLPVDPISTSEYPTPAPRPAYSVLDNRRWRDLGETPLPPWRDGLHSYLIERGLATHRGQLG